MEIKRHAPGPRMSEAVVYNGVAYLAGQVADKTVGQSVEAQMAEVVGLIDALLAKLGSDKTKILSATIYLADISTFAEMNKVWDKWVVAGATPARATVEAKLAAPQYKVEVQLTAAV